MGDSCRAALRTGLIGSWGARPARVLSGRQAAFALKASRSVKLSRHEEVGNWPDHDLDGLTALGFVPVGRLEDGVNSVAILTQTDPPTFALLYGGTPYVELHSVFPRGFAVVTTDTPNRVDEFGEHEGRRERPDGMTQHRFLEPGALFEAHRSLVEEVGSSRGQPKPTGGLEGAERRLRSLTGRRSWRDVQSLLSLALVFLSTVALAVAALSYFGE